MVWELSLMLESLLAVKGKMIGCHYRFDLDRR